MRNFITWFSEDGCGKLGQEDFGRIQRLCQHQDNLLSRAAQRMTVRIQTRIPHLAQTSDAVNRQLSCFSSRYMNLLAVFQI